MLNLFLLFVAGLFVLIKGSDFFVEAASRIAKLFGISDFIIGLTLVAVGTSLPELGVAIASSISGNSGLVVGNILGSNIANIGLILGLAAMFSIIEIKSIMFRRDGIFLLAITMLFFLLALNGGVSRLEGVSLLLMFFFYVTFILRFDPGKKEFGYDKFLGYLVSKINPKNLKKVGSINLHTFNKLLDINLKLTDKEGLFSNLLKQLSIMLLGIVAIFLGAEFTAASASEIALGFGIPESIVGLLMIAIGTSLPELVVSLTSLHKGLSNILVGNIIGSNIANLLLVGGVSSLINPMILLPFDVFYFLPFMLLTTVLLLVFIRSYWILRLFEGMILFGIYMIFVLSFFLFI